KTSKPNVASAVTTLALLFLMVLNRETYSISGNFFQTPKFMAKMEYMFRYFFSSKLSSKPSRSDNFNAAPSRIIPNIVPAKKRYTENKERIIAKMIFYWLLAGDDVY